MAKLAVLAVLASLLGAVSCQSPIYAGYGYPAPGTDLPYPLPRASPTPSYTPALKVGYYAKNCSNAEEIVKKVVYSATAGQKAGLVRLFFHDCFVQGCDASVLLNGNDTEKQAFPNLSLRGFEVIDAAKEALEKACPGVVSCADIVAFAGRDASYDLSNRAINYDVPAGRYDGKASRSSDTRGNLPPPFGNLTVIKDIFAAKGLSLYDMVVLSGAHSIGVSHCSSFASRLRADNSSTAMETNFAQELNQTCNAGNSSTTVPQDFKTPDSLDNEYYNDVLINKVLFNSDAVLASEETKGLVNCYAYGRNCSSFFGPLFGTLFGPLYGQAVWNRHFGQAMVKMGNIGVKSSTEGEIRKVCGSVNSY